MWRESGEKRERERERGGGGREGEGERGGGEGGRGRERGGGERERGLSLQNSFQSIKVNTCALEHFCHLPLLFYGE